MGKRICYGRWMIKAFCAGCTAFILLNAFSLIYSCQETHTSNLTGATDYIWERNGYFSRMTEGISWGHFDEQGFNNSYPAEDAVDILLMGSSHIEALQMPQNKNAGYLLNEYFHQENNSDNYVYSIGVSGHTFAICISNLEDALAYYHPQKAVVVETMTLNFTKEEIDSVLNNTRRKISSIYETGILYQLQKVPCLRIFYNQVQKMWSANDDNTDVQTDTQQEKMSSLEYSSEVGALLSQASNLMGDCQLVVLYHPTLSLENDGSVSDTTDPQQREIFAETCRTKGIIFVDMTELFIQAYEAEHILPNGFANTAVGTGHLNQNGHRMIAEELARVLTEME